MTRVALNAQHFSNHLQLFSVFALYFKSHTTANFRQLSRQVNESAFRSDILRDALGNNVRTARFIPFSTHFE
jgi:hypothetical protein